MTSRHACTPAPVVLWFTGLSGAGKSTIASAVADQLRRRAIATEYLDGDAVRLFSPTGFSRADRDAHVQRVGFLASRLEHHGVTVVCALISPYAEARQSVRRLCRRFVEIYVATPLAECERRDPKGLYRRARQGAITHFTGIDDPYEPPPAPDLVLDTRNLSVDAAVQAALAAHDRAAEVAMFDAAGSVTACDSSIAPPRRRTRLLRPPRHGSADIATAAAKQIPRGTRVPR